MLERLTYREGNVPVLKLSVVGDADGSTLAYAWANPEATRIGINLGWVQVGLDPRRRYDRRERSNSDNRFPSQNHSGFEDARRAHAGADAHRHHAVLLLAAAQAVHQRRRAHRAGRAERMAERDRAAERIDFRRVEADIADHRQRLRGERFVEFDPVQLLLRDADLLQRARNRFLRPDAHDLRRHAGHRETDEARERRQVVVLERLLARQQHRAGAVGHLRTVAGRHGAAHAEHRLQLGQCFERRVRARAFVGVDPCVRP